jgi:chromate transporter
MQSSAVSQRVDLVAITRVFLKIGAMSYGGPAIVGIMETEIQERRHWISKWEFIEGLALVNMLPGPLVTQLGIFIGHKQRGLAGGILAGVSFLLPAFLIMVGLAAAYARFGAVTAMRNALYGIGPVVLGIYVVAVYRLGKGVVKRRAEVAILVAAATLMLVTSVGLIVTLAAAGCVGIVLFYSRRVGVIALSALVGAFGAYSIGHIFFRQSGTPLADLAAPSPQTSPGLVELAAFFFKVGAFIFGGGLSMLAFIQEQVVTQFGWLTPQEFVDRLALAQLPPGPVPMLSAFIGFKLAGFTGAVVTPSAMYLPSFLMMLSILPLLRKMRDLQWLRAVMRGVGPAVIGALAVSLAQMAPYAAPDIFTWVVLALTVTILLLRNVGPLPLVLGGGFIGVLRKSAPWERVTGFVPA